MVSLCQQWSAFEITCLNIQMRARTEEVMLIRRELLECQRMLQSSEALFCICISCILFVYLMHKNVHCLLIIVILSSGRCGCVNNLKRGFAEDLSDLAEQTSGEEKDFKLKAQLWVEWKGKEWCLYFGAKKPHCNWQRDWQEHLWMGDLAA